MWNNKIKIALNDQVPVASSLCNVTMLMLNWPDVIRKWGAKAKKYKKKKYKTNSRAHAPVLKYLQSFIYRPDIDFIFIAYTSRVLINIYFNILNTPACLYFICFRSAVCCVHGVLLVHCLLYFFFHHCFMILLYELWLSVRLIAELAKKISLEVC